ncbi:hypothetical protein INR49_016144, partial [Caranx melampygus]
MISLESRQAQHLLPVVVFHLNEMHKPGDVVLGGLFEVHYTSVFPEWTFTSEPQQPSCKGFDTLGFRHAITMAFAIDEINKNSSLLPNVTLGYSLYDNCGAVIIGFSGALSLASGQEEQFVLQDNCLGTPPVVGIVRAMIQILKHFGWTWVGLLVSDDDYGLHVAQSLQSDLVEYGGGCLAYLEVLPWDSDPTELKRIVYLIKTSTARVVIVFAHEIHMIQLMEEVLQQDVTGRQWMASEAWSSATVLQTPRLMPYLSGTLGISIRRGEIPGLREFLLQIRPDQNYNSSYGNSMVRQFWEYTFQCRFAPVPAGWIEAGGTLCTGDEDLESVETEFLDLSNLRGEYNVYKAVYAIAYALDDILQCDPGRGPFSGKSCATLQTLEPWQPPRSVCSESCPPGTRVARKKGNLNVVLTASLVLRERSAIRLCTSCPDDFWSSPQRDHCVPKKTEFLSYHEPLGICLTTTSLLGTLICAAQTMLFAIDEINRNPKLLPNVTLGYSVYDNCNILGIGFRAALSLASGQEERVTLYETCVGPPPVLGIVGEDSSTRSIAVSTVLGLYRVPLVSYFATCSCLSDRQKFPSFFRTIPSDAFQVRAMIQILKHFGWTWAGLLISDNDYGLHAARSFQSDLGPSGGGCLAYLEVLPEDEDRAELRRIVDVMRKSTARVVIVFAHEGHIINLVEEVVRQNVTGLQWMASEAWTSFPVLQTPRLMPYLGGTLGIAIRRGEISGFREFLLQIRPDLHHNSYGNNMVNQFWEYTFQCRFAPAPAGWVESGGTLCTGQEELESVATEFLDILNLRPEYNVYKAVYALAYALDNMLQCEPGRGPFSGNSCGNLQRLEPWQ